MGKIQIITNKQKELLDEIVRNNYLREKFYFTGGTALSYFYLKHRVSEDLDFFSEEKIDQQIIFSLMSELSGKLGFTFSSRFVEVVYRFDINFGNKEFRVDFGFYPYKRIETGKNYKGFPVDSLKDIGANKLLTINQRTSIKDFVDLYFLLKNEFSFWDLLHLEESKFRRVRVDTMLLAEDFLKVEDFDILPRMIKPLKLETLKRFYRNLAKELGLNSVE